MIAVAALEFGIFDAFPKESEQETAAELCEAPQADATLPYADQAGAAAGAAEGKAHQEALGGKQP